METTATTGQLISEQIQFDVWNDDYNQHFCENCCHKFHRIKYNQEELLCDTCLLTKQLSQELLHDEETQWDFSNGYAWT